MKLIETLFAVLFLGIFIGAFLFSPLGWLCVGMVGFIYLLNAIYQKSKGL